MIGINNRVARLTAEANSKRNEEAGRIDWQGMASFSGGWTIPASSSDGIQTIVQTCCNPSCGASHLVDFRVVDGLAEFRTYSVMEKSHDGIQDEDGARASTTSSGRNTSTKKRVMPAAFKGLAALSYCSKCTGI